MQIQNDIKYNLTLEEIETAIKQYVDSQIQYALDYSNTKVDFTYVDINKDDDDRGPYRPIMRVQSAVVKPSFLE